MKILSAAVAALVVAGLVSAAEQAGGPRRDGNWEVTMTMEMPGMPQGMGMPPTKTTQCITVADAADPQKSVPQRPAGRGGNPNDCKISDYKAVGNTVTWTMACDGARPMTGKGEFVYGPDHYTGTITMDMGRGGSGGPGGAMAMKYEGKRLGDCTK